MFFRYRYDIQKRKSILVPLKENVSLSRGQPVFLYNAWMSTVQNRIQIVSLKPQYRYKRNQEMPYKFLKVFSTVALCVLGDFGGFSLILNKKYLFHCWRLKNIQINTKKNVWKLYKKNLPHWDLLHRQFSSPPQRRPRFHFLGPGQW
jgi:hypothetical protein